MLLIDTDILIDLLRNHQPALDWLNSLGDNELFIPGFVAMELLQGCRNKTELRSVRKVLSDYSIVWPSESGCNRALSVFADNFLKHGLGVLDALIAQIAVDLAVPLATFNQKHYTSVPELLTVQPYKR